MSADLTLQPALPPKGHVDVPAIETVPASRLRLLIITDTDVTQRGGSERFLTHLIEGLDPGHFEIDLVQLSRGGDREASVRQPSARREHVNVEYRPVVAIYGRAALAVWWELAARIRRGRYDIVQSQHEKADLLNALLPGGPNRPLRISNRRDTGFQKSLALRALFLLLNHRFDRLIAPANAILERLIVIDGVDRTRTHCLPNGVDCERFRPIDPDDVRRLRPAHGLPADAYLVGCAARLVPVKRHEDLVAGFAAAARAHADARLVLVGRGPLESKLRRQAEALDVGHRVIFLGEHHDMETLLPLFDAFALASSTEGLSNALLEAMACGLPTVATRVGGNPELVEPAVTGYLVDPERPDQLSLALAELLGRREQGRSMGLAARQRAERLFSLPAMIAAFTAFYSSAGSRRRA